MAEPTAEDREQRDAIRNDIRLKMRAKAAGQTLMFVTPESDIAREVRIRHEARLKRLNEKKAKPEQEVVDEPADGPPVTGLAANAEVLRG